jgi:hypothetical protein
MTVNSWDVYLRRINQNGSSQKDRLVANAQRIITDNFSNSPSFETVTINGTSQEVNIVDENSLFKNPNKKRILCKPDETISNGDLVVWDSENWLCTDTDDIEVYVRGIIEKCNNNLKYLSSVGATVTVPCIISDRILLDAKENKYYILPNNEIWVIVDSNSDSTPIDVDQRFLLSGNAYKVEAIDNITKPGLITFKMCFDSIVEDDNTSLGIANYTSMSHTYAILILNGSEINLSLGSSLQLEIECTDNDEVVTSPTVAYSLLTGSTGFISVSTSGLVSGAVLGSGSVKATYSSSTDSIAINIVTSTTSLFTYNLVANIEPSNEIKYNQTKSYMAHKYYSTGTEVTSSQFTFTVTLGTSSNTSNFLLSTSSDNSANLKCLEYVHGITLVATDDSDITQNVARVITLKGLI